MGLLNALKNRSKEKELIIMKIDYSNYRNEFIETWRVKGIIDVVEKLPISGDTLHLLDTE